MHENEISKIVLDICFDIHNKLGSGLLESVYEEILCYELAKRKLSFTRQQPMPVYWEDIKMQKGYKTDVIVENKVIIELKSVEYMNRAYSKTLLTYLRISNLKLGLLINFNEALLKNGISRIVNSLED